MGSPSSSLATLRPDLAGCFEEFDLEMQRLGFIGHRVFPVIEAAKAGGTFGRIPLEQLLKMPETRRAPGAGYARGKWTFEPASYATEENGYEEAVDDNEATMYRDYFDAEAMAARRAFNIVLTNAERRVASKVFDATTFTGDLTTAVTNEWDDTANATPINDVESAVQAVHANSGLWPNALVINRKVFRNLRNCEQILDRVKYSGHQDPKAGNITIAALAEVFDLEFLLVAGSSVDAAKEGQPAQIASVWSDEYAMVCRIATDSDIKSPCIGRTLHWAEDGSEIGGTVETYRDESVRGDVVRVRHQTDEKMLYTQAGHLLSNITT